MPFGFEFGACKPLLIRRETVALGLGRSVRLLYASDLHLGHWWTRGVPAQLLHAVDAERPDLVLLGGDLADNSSGLPLLAECVAALARLAPVHAVAGNHDEKPGLPNVRAAVTAAGGHWLADEPIANPLPIDARITPAGPPPRILCAHNPAVFPEAVCAGYAAVLAGHLHGGQCVWFTSKDRLYPAAWVHRWHGLRFQENGSVMFVSRGAADTLPVRFNCPREVILCEIR